jgi:hypothetical protein
MATKAQALEKYKAYEAWVQTQCSQKIKIFQTDNGGEFICREFKSYLQKQGADY